MYSVEVVWRGQPDHADALEKAISPDDADDFSIHMTVRDEEAELCVRVSSGSLASLKATIDDILACLSAAEGTLDAVLR